MPLANPPITNTQVIPLIGSQLFEDHLGSHFAVGIVAKDDVVMPGLEEEYYAYLLLRGNVYAGQKMYMPMDDLSEDGTETDSDDERSIHFAVVENVLTSTRVVGAMRLIIKSRTNDGTLPIEVHYPDAFTDGAAPVYSVESSRVIARHENSKIQRGIKWMLFTAGLSYVANHGLGPVYGAVEPGFARGLQMEGLPATVVAGAKFVKEFNATKQLIRVDLDGLTQKIEDDQPDLFDAIRTQEGDFVYSGVVSSTLIDEEITA